MSFIRSLVGFSISSWIGFVIGIISVPLLTRLLDPIQYAIINQFNAAVLFFLSLVTVGMDSGFVRFFFEPPNGFTKNQLLGKCIWYSILVLLTLGILCIPFYSNLSEFLFGIEHWISSLMFFIAVLAQIILRYFTIYYRMMNKIVAFTIIGVLLQLFSKFSLLIALPFHGDNNLLLAANTISILLLSLVVLLWHAKNKTFSWSSDSILQAKEFTKYSLGSWPVPLVLYANIYFSQIIIRQFAGERILGIYLSANIFAAILGVVQYGFTNYWSAFMFESYSKKQALIKKVHDYVCLFSILVICGLILFKDLLYLFIGPQYQDSKSIFALVLTAPLFTMIGETTAYGISIEKKAHLSFISYFSYFVVNIGLALLLVPKMGMFGAAVSLMSSALINLFIQTLFGQKYYSSVESLKRTAYTVIVILLLAIINYYFNGNRFVIFYSCVSIVFLTILIYFKPLIYAFEIIKNSNLKLLER